MPRRNGSSKQLRLRIAHEAARLMAEHGIGDFLLAKRKAAATLGVDDRGSLPRNSEIEAALRESHRLFGGDAHRDALDDMRQAALRVMRDFGEFDPRAVGGVITGAISASSAIELHLFADPAELVGLRLLEIGCDHEVAHTRLRTGRDRYDTYHAYHLEVADFTVEMTVFPRVGLRQAPLSPVDGRPMQRLSITALTELLESDEL